MKCPLHIASYALRIGVSVMELKGSEFLISHTFQRKHYISIACTGNVMMYALGPFSRKRSHALLGILFMLAARRFVAFIRTCMLSN